MTKILEVMQQPWVYALGWTILHSLWQSAFIACGCAIVLFFTKQVTANFRYLVALAGLMCCVFSSAITFYRYFGTSAGTTVDAMIILCLYSNLMYSMFPLMQ